jgi:hypothetical protein
MCSQVVDGRFRMVECGSIPWVNAGGGVVLQGFELGQMSDQHDPKAEFAEMAHLPEKVVAGLAGTNRELAGSRRSTLRRRVARRAMGGDGRKCSPGHAV